MNDCRSILDLEPFSFFTLPLCNLLDVDVPGGDLGGFRLLLCIPSESPLDICKIEHSSYFLRSLGSWPFARQKFDEISPLEDLPAGLRVGDVFPISQRSQSCSQKSQYFKKIGSEMHKY